MDFLTLGNVTGGYEGALVVADRQPYLNQAKSHERDEEGRRDLL